MRMMYTRPAATANVEAARSVGRPGDTIVQGGTYWCLCCGASVKHLRKDKRFPDCCTNNCPTMWMWSEQ
jgi:hypothetical protein